MIACVSHLARTRPVSESVYSITTVVLSRIPRCVPDCIYQYCRACCAVRPALLPHTIPASLLVSEIVHLSHPGAMVDGFLDRVQAAAAQITEQITAIQIDDSSFPYLQAVVAFIAVEYVWETYLDVRQRCGLNTYASG